MESELNPAERCRILARRIQSLKVASGLSVESRLRELRKAELALKVAERDLALEKRARDKTSRAVKPIPSEADVAAKRWAEGMNMERRK